MSRKYLTALIFLVIALFFAGSTYVHSQVPQPVPNPSVQSENYVEDELIVKYRSELTPQELQLQVTERAEKKSTLLGSISLFFENLSYRFKNQETPETKLSRLQQADEQAGALNKTRIFDADDENQRNLFVIETDGSKSVDEMIQIYDALPEVEYAEPNYIFSTFGIE